MKKLILCGIFLVVAQTLFAAPSNISVSGTVSHGESITISGFDLGNHANYNYSGMDTANSATGDDPAGANFILGSHDGTSANTQYDQVMITGGY